MEISEKNLIGFMGAMMRIFDNMQKGNSECSAVCQIVTEKELFIVAYIGEEGSVKMREISDHFDLAISTLTSVVDRLVAKKVLTRYHSDEDRRVVKVTLAEKGKEVYQIYSERKKIIAENILSRFTEDEQIQMIELLNRIPAFEEVAP